MKKVSEIQLNLTDTPANIQQAKSKLIRKKLREIRELYKKNFKKFKTYKRYNTTFKVIINVLNACTVSSAVISFSGMPIIAILTIATSSISTILSVINSTIDFQARYHVYQTSYLQLKDLYDSNTSNLLSRHSNLDHILNDINQKLGLILDSSNPVSLSSTDETV